MENDSKVEQFVLLAKSAHGLALVDLIQKATAEPGLFTFGELLDLPAVQDLQQGEHAPVHWLLRLFAYGTWKDYKENAEKLPPLSPTQQHKLKLLTAVTLANARRTISYSDLMLHLEVESIRQLEDILISDCIYAGLIKGQLDQKAQCLHVDDAFARDVSPDQLPTVIAALGEWLATAQGVVADIETQIGGMTHASAATQQRRAELAEALENEKKSLRAAVELQAQQEVSAMALDEGDVFVGSLGEEGLPGSTRSTPGGGPSRVSKRRR